MKWILLILELFSKSLPELHFFSFFLPNQHGIDITLILNTRGKQLSDCGFGLQNNSRVKELQLS